MFDVNQELIGKARAILFERNNIYWVIGGACTGKSTICRAIAESKGIKLYDMDEHIFGRYLDRYSAERHPASKAWFSAENPLAWVLSLSEDEFDALNRTANAEYLDLLADDLAKTDPQRPVLIDGGVTHPAIIAQAIPPENLFGLEIPTAAAAKIWETSPVRADMKQWIYALPKPEEMWIKFLAFDQLISQTIGRECRESHIKTFLRNNSTSVAELARIVAHHFGI